MDMLEHLERFLAVHAFIYKNELNHTFKFGLFY